MNELQNSISPSYEGKDNPNQMTLHHQQESAQGSVVFLNSPSFPAREVMQSSYDSEDEDSPTSQAEEDDNEPPVQNNQQKPNMLLIIED